MSKHRIFNGIFIACLMFSMIVPALAEDKKAPEKKVDPAQEAAMAAWMAAATPGADHEWLNQWTGNWNSTSKSWWEGPDAPPTESKSTSKYGMCLGGRYLKSEVKGDMMGMPFEGEGTIGFDNFNKEYQMTWMDNFGTGTYTAKGYRSGNELSMEGTMDDVTTGEKAKKVTYKWILKDANTATFEMWCDGKLQMQDNMTRASK